LNAWVHKVYTVTTSGGTYYSKVGGTFTGRFYHVKVIRMGTVDISNANDVIITLITFTINSFTKNIFINNYQNIYVFSSL
jgi:hypothetical protein